MVINEVVVEAVAIREVIVIRKIMAILMVTWVFELKPSIC
jgi:hypothetical protein